MDLCSLLQCRLKNWQQKMCFCWPTQVSIQHSQQEKAGKTNGLEWLGDGVDDLDQRSSIRKPSKESDEDLSGASPILDVQDDPTALQPFPEIPIQILVSLVAPFLNDRTTLNNLALASKEVYRSCQEEILLPPWPNKMINLHCRLWSLAFSPDQTTLAVGGTNGRIHLLDRQRGLIDVLSGHLGRVYAIVFTENGDRMISLSGDGDLRIWDMIGSSSESQDEEREGEFDDTNQELEQYGLQYQVATHTTHAVCLAYNKQNMSLASGGEGDIQLYSIPHGVAGMDVLTMEQSRFLVESIAFSPDGNFVAAGTSGNKIHLWNLNLRKCITSFRESSSVHSLQFSPCGKYIAAGTDDRRIRVWNVATGDYFSLEGHRDMIWSVAWSPDGKRIASASDDGTVRVWSADTGSCTAIWDDHENASVYNVAFSPCGQYICSTSNDGYIDLRRLSG